MNTANISLLNETTLAGPREKEKYEIAGDFLIISSIL
jgi:hypothetical protein